MEHQLIGHAFGAGTYRLKFGYHGGNHPVQYLPNGEVPITAQNRNTTEFFHKVGLPVETVNKFADCSPYTVDLIRDGRVQLVVNTPLGPHAHSDGAEIPSAALAMNIPLFIYRQKNVSANLSGSTRLYVLGKKDWTYSVKLLL